VHGFRVHAVRATAATTALAHNADIAKVQEWLGHAIIATMWLYDRRQSRPEESPTFQVEYETGARENICSAEVLSGETREVLHELMMEGRDIIYLLVITWIILLVFVLLTKTVDIAFTRCISSS
jgi:hypothetical protein